MLVTPSGIVTLVKELQLLNALSPILITRSKWKLVIVKLLLILGAINYIIFYIVLIILIHLNGIKEFYLILKLMKD